MALSITIKSALAALLSSSGYIPWRLKCLSKTGVVILMYHCVLSQDAIDGMEPGMYVEVKTFERHLSVLHNYFEVIPLNKNSIGGEKPRCVITFDDGWHDFYEYAFPALKAHSFAATIFLTTDYIGRERANNILPNRNYISWEEARVMRQSNLIAFGSHTASHRILTNIKDGDIRTELVQSRERLIAEKVVDPSFIPFAYPNGNYDDRVAALVKEAGYHIAVTTNRGWNGIEADPFTLKRIGIHQDMTSTDAMFAARIADII